MRASGSLLLVQGNDSAGHISPRGANRALLSSKQEEVFARPSQGAGSADFNVHKKDPRGQKIREGWVQKWHTKKPKIYNQRYLILWENKELVYYNTKPYNVRSPYKGIWRLTPAGTMFLLQDDENDMSCCFQLTQDGVTCRFACASDEERDWWVTPMLHMGPRLVLGPGLGESMNIKNLLQTLPEIQKHILLIPDLQKQKAALEQAKRNAVENEDFAAAQQIKEELDALALKLRNLEQNGSLVDLYQQGLPYSLAEIVEEIAVASDFVRRKEEYDRRLQEERYSARPTKDDGPDFDNMSSRPQTGLTPGTPERSKSPMRPLKKSGSMDNLRLSTGSMSGERRDSTPDGRDSLSISPHLMSLYPPAASPSHLTPKRHNSADSLSASNSSLYGRTSGDKSPITNINEQLSSSSSLSPSRPLSPLPPPPLLSHSTSSPLSPEDSSHSRFFSNNHRGSEFRSMNSDPNKGNASHSGSWSIVPKPTLVRCGSSGALNNITNNSNNNSSNAKSSFSSKLGSSSGVYFGSPTRSPQPPPPAREGLSMLPKSHTFCGPCSSNSSSNSTKFVKQGSLMSDGGDGSGKDMIVYPDDDVEDSSGSARSRVAHIRSGSDGSGMIDSRGSIFGSLFGGSSSSSGRFGRARRIDTATDLDGSVKYEGRGSVSRGSMSAGTFDGFGNNDRGEGPRKRGSTSEKGYRSDGEINSSSRKPMSPVLALGKGRKDEDDSNRSVYRKDKKGHSQSLKFDTKTMNPEDDDLDKYYRRPKTDAFFKSRDDTEKETKETRDSAAVMFSQQRRDEEVLRRYAQVRDRKKKLRTHLHCFVAKDVITTLVANSIVPTREEGVALGNRLVAAGIIVHVTKGGAEFRDKDSFYRFASQR